MDENHNWEKIAFAVGKLIWNTQQSKMNENGLKIVLIVKYRHQYKYKYKHINTNK